MRFRLTHFLLLCTLILSVSTRLFSSSNHLVFFQPTQNSQKEIHFQMDYSVVDNHISSMLNFNPEKENRSVGFNWSLYENEEDEEFFSFKKYLNKKAGIALYNSVQLYVFLNLNASDSEFSYNEVIAHLSSPRYIAYRIFRI